MKKETGFFEIGARSAKKKEDYLSKEPENIIFSDLVEILQVRFSDGLVAAKDDVKKILKLNHITEEDAWKAAFQNTEEKTKIYTMDQFLPLSEDAPKDMMYLMTSAVETNPTPAASFGAGSIFMEKKIQEFAKWSHTTKVMILPSSIHEILLVPHEIPYMEAKQIVHDVNQTECTPDMVLSDHPYIYTVRKEETV